MCLIPGLQACKVCDARYQPRNVGLTRQLCWSDGWICVQRGLECVEGSTGTAIGRGYQSAVSPLIAPDRMAFRTSSIVARPPGAVPPHSNRVAAGVQ